MTLENLLQANPRNNPSIRWTPRAVLSVLKALWERAPETASRLRGRIETVLDAAKAKARLHPQTKPTRPVWRGHLDKLLPKRGKLTRGHHAAMPYADVPAFLAELRQASGDGGAGAGILHFDRGPFRGGVGRALEDEIDLDAKVWTVRPDARKPAREHRVRCRTERSGDPSRKWKGRHRRARFPRPQPQDAAFGHGV